MSSFHWENHTPPAYAGANQLSQLPKIAPLAYLQDLAQLGDNTCS